MGTLQVTSELLDGNFDLLGKPMKVGRGMDCDIQLKHKSVSRHHCIITERDGSLRIEDLGSTYGTYLNSTQVSDAYAKDGDTIRVGRIAIRYHQEGAIPVAEVVDASPEVSEQTVPPKKVLPTPQTAITSRKPAAAPSAKKKVPQFKFNPPAPKPSSPGTKKMPIGAMSPAAAKAAATAAAGEETDSKEGTVTNLKRKPVAIGLYNRNNGRTRKDKAERPDYHEEAAAWEEAADDDDNRPDYAGEDEDWNRVWGKQRKLKGFFGSLRGGIFSGLLGSFAGMQLKMRMAIVFSVMVLIAGIGYTGYKKATANVLVPKIKTKPKGAQTKGMLGDIIEKAKKSLPQNKAASELKDE